MTIFLVSRFMLQLDTLVLSSKNQPTTVGWPSFSYDKSAWTTKGVLPEEIIWRYVTAKNKVVIFNAPNDLRTDVTYRQNVVTAAGQVNFLYASGTDCTYNENYWKLQTITGKLPNGTEFEVNVDLTHYLDPTAPFPAIQDVFGDIDATSPTKYHVACWNGARFVALRALSKTLTPAHFNSAVGSAPLTGDPDLFRERDVSNSLDDRAFWIPGDWGYVKSKSAHPELGYEGENVIYLGGCYDTDSDNFIAHANFWGHGEGVKTLEEMLEEVASWNGDAGSEISTKKYDLNEDQLHLLGIY